MTTPIAAATESRLRPTARAASSGARRRATSIRKVIRTIEPTTSGSRDLVAAAVVVENGGAAAEAGAEAGALVDRRGERAEAGVEAAGAGGVEAGVGDDQVAGGGAAAGDVDHLGGERAADRVGAVESGDGEIAGVEEARRERVELVQPALERVGGPRDPGAALPRPCCSG